MPPLYRLVEVGIYSLLNFLPLMVLALYPSRHFDVMTIKLALFESRSSVKPVLPTFTFTAKK